jgi:thioester reductase-like protein
MHFNVVLTGSTGNLGAYLLDELLSLPQVAHVICLNRAEEAEERQLEAHRVRGLTEALTFGRTRFITADVTDQRLGLSETIYTELANTTDVFIHNAWPVDFNRNIRSFKPFLEGINAITEFCRSPTQSNSTLEPIKLLFISSIGATSNWGGAAPTSRSQVPEAELTDWKVARTGYGQSKLLAERLLCCAVANYSLPVAIIRVGQLCGPVLHGVKGKWPEREWVPSIIKSSIALGVLPTTLGPTETVDWVPADVAARIIIEVVTPLAKDKLPETSKRPRKKEPKARFFHVVNPRTSQWADLVPAMTRRMSGVEMVSFVEWVDALKDSVKASGGYQQVNEGQNPAGKLIDFFDNLQDRAVRFPYARIAQLETTQMATVSETLRQLNSVTVDWMDMWMQQWGLGEDIIVNKEAARCGKSESTS